MRFGISTRFTPKSPTPKEVNMSLSETLNIKGCKYTNKTGEYALIENLAANG